MKVFRSPSEPPKGILWRFDRRQSSFSKRRSFPIIGTYGGWFGKDEISGRWFVILFYTFSHFKRLRTAKPFKVETPTGSLTDFQQSFLITVFGILLFGILLALRIRVKSIVGISPTMVQLFPPSVARWWMTKWVAICNKVYLSSGLTYYGWN